MPSKQLKQYKKRIAKQMLGGKCFVCGKNYGKGFVFHHIKYDKSSYRDFKTADDYTKFVCDEVFNSPERFALLCRGHHHAVEQLKRYSQEKFDNLMLLTLESRR